MILIAIIASLLALSYSVDLPNMLSEHSFYLHRICLKAVPMTLRNRESLEAIVCGKNINDLEVRQLLVDTSLIHIFVVSGSHFLLLRSFLARVLGKSFWCMVPLFLYAMVTLCQPPSMRALAFLALGEIALRRKLFLSNIQILLLSGILCLAFFPLWIHSRSLLMSLMAALAMTVSDEILDRKLSPVLRAFLAQSFMYFAMSLCLWGLSGLHPLSILMNVLVGPLIGTLLFPTGIFAMVFPITAPVFDTAMDGLIWLMAQADPLLQANSEATPLEVGLQWILITGFVFTAHMVSVKRRRLRYEA